MTAGWDTGWKTIEPQQPQDATSGLWRVKLLISGYLLVPTTPPQRKRYVSKKGWITMNGGIIPIVSVNPKSVATQMVAGNALMVR